MGSRLDCSDILFIDLVTTSSVHIFTDVIYERLFSKTSRGGLAHLHPELRAWDWNGHVEIVEKESMTWCLYRGLEVEGRKETGGGGWDRGRRKTQ